MRKLLFNACAVLLFSSLFSFPLTANGDKGIFDKYMWFDFTGGSVGDYANLSYYIQDPYHLDPCGGTGLRCEIYAKVIATGPYAGKPDLTTIYAETKRQ